MPVRPHILTNAAGRQDFIDAALALNRELSGVRTQELGIAGPDTELSTWDLFALWHYNTMNTPTPPGTDRNAAHRGPVFLPWHRWFLLLMETQMQRVLNKPTFGLPYWDWAADGDRPEAQQPALPIWDAMGHTGFPLSDGPFAFSATNAASFRVRVFEDPTTGRLRSVDRGLWRQLGEGAPGLPQTAAVTAALRRTAYDRSPYLATTRNSFRNELEGWVGQPGPGLHNLVHVWIGGDMGPGTSPNDPMFYLNHCNADRIWEGWMSIRGRVYQPSDTASPSLFRHRPGDPLLSMLTAQQPLIRQMLDLATFVPAARRPTYDVLPSLP